MKKEFELPDLGEGIAEGELVTWHVEPGDVVEENEVIAEVETDKALVDLPSPYDGTITELRAEPGDIVPVKSVLVVFDTEGDETDVIDDHEEESSDDEQVAGETAQPEQSAFARPRVRRLARELGVDISTLQPSDGRITEHDVRAAASGEQPVDDTPHSGATPPETDTSADRDSRAQSAKPSASRSRTLAVPATRRIAREEGIDLNNVPTNQQRDGEAFVTADDVRAFASGEHTPEMRTEASTQGPRPGERVPYTGIRRTVGERMVTSKFTAPHVSHHDEVEVSSLVETRSALKPRAEEQGISLTYLAFGVMAATAALKEVPALNAELDEENEEIILHDEYHIGIAVETEAGLMVPVIEHADQKSLFELAEDISEKAERARSRSIALEELQGSTFTITNVGGLGGIYASPIINYPEAGILALGALEKRPWVEDGEVVARHTLPISMTSDHRIVDGAAAAKFTNVLKDYLHNPALLLVD